MVWHGLVVCHVSRTSIMLGHTTFSRMIATPFARNIRVLVSGLNQTTTPNPYLIRVVLSG